MNKAKSIVVLNNLIEINNDRIEGYEIATKITEENDLKNLFSEFQETSLKCKSELVEEVKKMGGIPVEKTKITARLLKFWYNFMATLNYKEREDLLNSCEYEDFVLIKNYRETVSNNIEYLTYELQIKLKAQQLLLKADHDKVKELGDLMLV